MIQVCASSGIHGDLPASTCEEVSVCLCSCIVVDGQWVIVL